MDKAKYQTEYAITLANYSISPELLDQRCNAIISSERKIGICENVNQINIEDQEVFLTPRFELINSEYDLGSHTQHPTGFTSFKGHPIGELG